MGSERKDEEGEGGAVFTLEFYRQLSRSNPIPTLAHKVRGGRSKGQKGSVEGPRRPPTPNRNGSTFKSTRWEGKVRLEPRHSFPNQPPSGIPAFEVGQYPSSRGHTEDPEAQFPSPVVIWKSQPRDGDVTALPIWEAPLTAGPLAAVPCISGSKRSRGHWSS